MPFFQFWYLFIKYIALSRVYFFIETNIISMAQTPCYTVYERNIYKLEDFLATDDDNL